MNYTEIGVELGMVGKILHGTYSTNDIAHALRGYGQRKIISLFVEIQCWHSLF